MNNPDVILCLAANYRLEQVEPFIASWRQHAPTAALAMFSANMDQAFYAAAADLGVKLLAIDPQLASQYHPQTGRYFLYRAFLEAHGGEYGSVLICDVRDVVLQGDPFAVERDAPVWFAAEDQVFSSCPWNTGWLRQAYGEDLATNFGTKTISCSGTTLGEASAMLDYIRLMCGQAEDHPEVAQVTGMDQGFHNYILHQLQPPFIALDIQDRAVATIGYTQTTAITIDNGSVLVGGAYSPVVHQWDRHPEVESFVREGYKLPQSVA